MGYSSGHEMGSAFRYAFAAVMKPFNVAITPGLRMSDGIGRGGIEIGSGGSLQQKEKSGSANGKPSEIDSGDGSVGSCGSGRTIQGIRGPPMLWL